MSFALSLFLRVIVAVAAAFAAWRFLHLPTAAVLSAGQLAFFLSVAAYQPNWRALLGEQHLLKAVEKITPEERKLSCGGGKSKASCNPQAGHAHKKAIELEFCIQKVESKVAKLEEEVWKQIIPIIIVTAFAVLLARIDTNGSVSAYTLQAIELVLPLTLFFFTLGLIYAEISAQRGINLSAAL
jgi:hypothetical protein